MKTSLTKQDVLDRFADYGVERVGLFGSFMREKQTKDSDINLLVDLTN